jgi:hypothetical protein
VHWLQQAVVQVQQTLQPQVRQVVRAAVAVMLAVDLEHQAKETKAATDRAQVIILVAAAVLVLLEATHLQVETVEQAETV